jgi:DNA polymerase III alpha subunit
MGSAVEEAPSLGVLLLPPCVNHCSDWLQVEQRLVVCLGDPCVPRVWAGTAKAYRGGLRGVGDFTSLLDFCSEVERRLVSHHDVRFLIKLGAFSFAGSLKALLAAASSNTPLSPTYFGQRRVTGGIVVA